MLYSLAQKTADVLTVSDSRTLDSDRGGRYLVTALEQLQFTVRPRHLVPDEIAQIRATVLEVVESNSAVLLITGGTAIAHRDVTPDAVLPLLGKKLPGYGETFRRLAFENIGPQAILSRADAGIIARTLVFLLPGSPEAVELAMQRLIAPILHEALHLLHCHQPPLPT